ncbi:carboxypeptidase regulatory-like domain-containing protein [Pseudoflavitalea sp. X16]|uniref:carboxypeptidase-like regulatory domain-containing protein n=1 Tax=Paraflavitalea devenefica TaxID=2716334 RepID=UPI001420C8F8|nr:carboxypeptidase-like regulatory domain-containing protein [Paraflavitalea devenefica]NII28087.1 carboxypeptidase regulatory-like domain-containing protein [Paraflavitalea devenefica]
MNKTRLPILLGVIITVLSASCEKRDHAGIISNLSKPDLSIKVTAAIAGFITDESNAPLAGAQVKAGNKQTITDEYGYFSINDVSLSEVAGFVKIAKAGYFDNYRTFLVNKDQETFVRAKMLLKKEAGVVDAVTGGTVTSTDGIKLTLPANGVVKADNGAVYTGDVHVNVRKIDPSNAEEVQLTLPGDERGTDVNEYLKLLKSYSSFAAELTGNAGERLQIAPGKQATVDMPVSAALLSLAPTTLELWSFNETNGLWKQEGQATKTGNNYRATVSHFSYWSDAIGYPLVNFTARVVNSTGQPLVHVPVMITIANQPMNAGFSKFAYTDADGYVYGAVLSNTGLVLDILTPCATSAYSHPFTTTNVDVDLGTLTGNLGQNTVTISGTVSNCDNAPVTDGYIQTYDNGFYNRINIVNGSFSFTGLACTNTEVNYVAVDKATNQQTAPQSLTLIPGVNDLGMLNACGISTVSTVSYTINNGATKILTAPVDTIGGFFTAQQTGWTTVLLLDAGQNTVPDWNFQFSGADVAGNDHKLTEVFSTSFPGARAYAPVPLTVTITEFGKAGGFITGSFSGLMLGFSDNSIQNIVCNFRVKRMN